MRNTTNILYLFVVIIVTLIADTTSIVIITTTITVIIIRQGYVDMAWAHNTRRGVAVLRDGILIVNAISMFIITTVIVTKITVITKSTLRQYHNGPLFA